MASKGKKNKVKFHWTKELGFLIGALVSIIVATVILAIPTKAEKLASKYNDAIALQNAANAQSGSSIYTIPTKDHVFKEIEFEDIEELTEIVKNEECVFVVYGSENNATFLQQLYTLNTYAEEYEIDTIYIYSSLWVEEQEDLQAVESQINENEKALDPTLELSLTEYPALLVFANGELVFNSQKAEDISTWNGYMDYVFPKYGNKAE